MDEKIIRFTRRRKEMERMAERKELTGQTGRSLSSISELREFIDENKDKWLDQELNFELMEEIAEEIYDALPETIGTDKYIPIIQLTKSIGFTVCERKMLKKHSGRITVDKQGDVDKIREIIVNQRDPFEQQRFVVGHELGHYIFQYKGTGFYSDTYHKDDHKSDQEQLVNRFAACILMPRKRFKETVNQIRKTNNNDLVLILSLAERFKVPVKAVIKRLEEVGIG